MVADQPDHAYDPEFRAYVPSNSPRRSNAYASSPPMDAKGGAYPSAVYQDDLRKSKTAQTAQSTESRQYEDARDRPLNAYDLQSQGSGATPTRRSNVYSTPNGGDKRTPEQAGRAQQQRTNSNSTDGSLGIGMKSYSYKPPERGRSSQPSRASQQV